MTLLKNRKVKGVPGLSFVKLPLYIPTGVVGTLPELSKSLSGEEIKSLVDAIYASEPISDTLFDSLRETNATPHLSQAQALRSIRASCKAELEKIDTEIQRLYSKISDLSQALSVFTAKRIQTQNISSLCSSWLSSIRRLPPEILGEIFIRCLPSPRRPVATVAPLLLTHVCSAWRRTALGFPRLWNHLYLRPTASPDEDASSLKMSNIMDLWFKRASNSPLTFHLYSKYTLNRERDRTIVNAMVKHAGQFRKLHVSSALVNDIYGFITHTPGHLDRLESLQLEIGDFDESETIITVFDEAPLLREVILNVGAVGLVAHLILPWKQLTNISVIGTAVYQADLLYMLHECEQLVSGSFTITTGVGDREIVYAFGAPIVLEHLVDLKVSLSLPHDFEDNPFIAIDKLSLPMLTHFSLMGDYGEYTHLSHIPLLGVIQTAPRLQHFTLLEFFTGPEDLLPILQATPHLTFLKLAVNSESAYNPLIEALRYVDNQSNIYVPLLESLDIRVESVLDGLDVSELMAMVRSRRITSFEVPRSPVAYLNVHLRVSKDLLLVDPGLSPTLDILNSAETKGEIEISAYDSDDDDNYDSISLDL